MLDGVSLDQLRAFIAAVDEGSFSAGARKLRRAQSAISELVSNLEGQIGVALFDRSARYPKLTPAGLLLLGDARSVVGNVDQLKARAKGIAGGLESELSAVVDVLFPIEAITSSAKEFRHRFPRTPLRLYVEALGGAYKPVIDGRCSLGVVGSLPLMPPSMTSERLNGVEIVMVAAREHPLAAVEGVITKVELAKHVQLVLTDRSELSAGREFGVLSPLTWRLGDLFAKHSFLLGGLGWGGMPLHAVKRDLAEGRLVTLPIEDMTPEGMILPMSVVYLTAQPPGPAGRWFIERLKQCPSRHAAAEAGVHSYVI
ncbi:MAG TPA: LysR family transcriptional regulator [Steroidobacteraceae bacterium]|jgi:DNA-binding transcriptional LysR family regulator|nr:LysR family transcriptional regulator [Steroidobacteraceae bacterium]